MSGKLIMKRKMDKALEDNNVNNMAEEVSPADNSPHNTDDENSNESRARARSSSDSSTQTPRVKRLRCDTPPPEENDLGHDLPPLDAIYDNVVNNERNRHLLEAIQSKMLELQQELDEFEQDFEDDYYNAPPSPHNVMSEQEAEALGFAMCAQETILFLQREGIASDSLLYTRLRDALVGRAENDPKLQI